MKKIIAFISFLIIVCVSLSTTSCQKKEKGNCYCKYVSGDKKHFNLNALPRNQQVDSCAVIDHNAEAFGGSCEMK